MADGSLFGHLAFRFATHPENLATEALAYVLQNSEIARLALIAYCRQLGGTELHGDLHFRTQGGVKDAGIPDLVGVDGDGHERLLIEAKFWAGLTDQQPTVYLGRLTVPGGLLLVVAPSLRLTTLWDELRRRCVTAMLKVTELPGAAEGIRGLSVGTAECSWSIGVRF